ncbi:acyltransferase family protein [Flavitalea flava]
MNPLNKETPTAGSQRLYSLDALRGFDMIWIMGLGYIVKDYSKTKSAVFWNVIGDQLDHRVWDGFTFWDLIFPLFMFMAGVSIPYSLGRELEKDKSKKSLLLKIIKRGLILILLGMIYNNGLQFRPVADFRFPSVLGKIGATYLLAGIIWLYAKEVMQWVWFWGLLIGYWLLLKFTAAPGYLPGDLTIPGNFMSYLDRTLLPGKLSRGIYDTVGLICTISGISTVLLGIFTGNFLQRGWLIPLSQSQEKEPLSGTAKAIWMAVAGIISLILALIWNLDFPINKNIWSSSFVLWTGGLSLLLLSLFYYIIDVRGYKSWTLIFRVIGMNSILIYISTIFIDWEYTGNSLFKWLGQMVDDPYKMIIMAICTLAVKWFFLYFLYKKKIFLKV